MLFSQLIFVLFALVVICYLWIVRNNRARKLFLLLASYYFYAYWDYRFCSLLLLSTLINFVTARYLAQTERPATRKLLLAIAVVSSLGMLGFFKYCNFFIDSMKLVLQPLGWNLHTLDIVLPVGISFFTFQALSYTIDVYRRDLKPCEDISDFALFLAFFPQLVAGPIVRASDFLPQLSEYRPLTSERFFWGFQQFVRGLVKKVLIADQLAITSDFAFANMAAIDGWSVWLGVLAYTGQIYCDFSGYTDMAIGLARALGYDFCPNFDHPYVSTSITEFWRRWHISLSTWLRDYLYIPLGGNRKGPRRTYINLLLTMVLGGLWHGAAWTFLFWGFWHGLALSVDKLFHFHKRTDNATLPIRWIGWMFTMLAVMVGWVFFRAQSFALAATCLNKMFKWNTFNDGIRFIPQQALGCLAVLILFHGISVTRWNKLVELQPKRWSTPIILFFLIYLVIFWHPTAFTPFIYFQF